jgi:SAM-dependent methyltransferase
MYDDFSVDYDRFVDWSGRLAAELPFIEEQLRAVGACQVLDVACGTGMHAIALAQRGYALVGVDVSAGMIKQARANAVEAGADAEFEVAGFGALAQKLGGRRLQAESHDGGPDQAPSEKGIDAALCLGNSLPHLHTPDQLVQALADFAACLRPEGLLLIQNRNFDAVLARRERWMPLQAHQESGREWLFLRFYDYEGDGTLVFNVLTLRREEGGKWGQHLGSTRLWPLRQEELTAALEGGGFEAITCWGDMQGSPFDPETSGNLVVTARKRP